MKALWGTSPAEAEEGSEMLMDEARGREGSMVAVLVGSGSEMSTPASSSCIVRSDFLMVRGGQSGLVFYAHKYPAREIACVSACTQRIKKKKNSGRLTSLRVLEVSLYPKCLYLESWFFWRLSVMWLKFRSTSFRMDDFFVGCFALKCIDWGSCH
jgi:hypothetical protein